MYTHSYLVLSLPFSIAAALQFGDPLLLTKCSRSRILNDTLFVPPTARLIQYKPQQLLLKPIQFEIPGFQHDMTLIGRDWLFPDLERMLTKESMAAKNKGVAILGEVGFGKTAIIAKLISLSALSGFLTNSSPEETGKIFFLFFLV